MNEITPNPGRSPFSPGRKVALHDNKVGEIVSVAPRTAGTTDMTWKAQVQMDDGATRTIAFADVKEFVDP